jgi:prepilin-type N-terminal cleavage/methylation domain-containing protein
MHSDSPRTLAKRAFSLVELSIVLVILGLLIGGILSGQSLIRAAELRSVTTEVNRYRSAMFTFRDKYFQLPGDMNNAYAFWGSTLGCTNNDSTVVSTGCNGNGNGQLEEFFRAWQHLTAAGLIEGRYSGTATGGTAVPGTNVPASKLSNGAWGLWPFTLSGWLGWQGTQTANWVFVGSYYATNQPISSVLKPEEAWNIDSKVDDGMPATGKVYGGPGYNTGGCTSGAGTAAIYALSTNSVTCSIAFMIQ